MNWSRNNPLWGWLSLVLAVMHAVVWPRDVHQAESLSPLAIHIILRWFPSLTWLLLAVSFFIRSIFISPRKTLANKIAFAALFCYATFIVAFIYFRYFKP